MSTLDIQVPGITNPVIKIEDLDEEDENDASNLGSEPDTEHPTTDEDSPVPAKSQSGAKSYRSNVSELQKYPPLLISTLFSYMAIVILKIPVTLNEIFGYFLGGSELIVGGSKRTRFLIIMHIKWFHRRCSDDYMDTRAFALPST
jgi:hypothetical protein